METFLGLLLALGLGWVGVKLGEYLRVQRKIELGRTGAIAVGFGVALGLLFLLRQITEWPSAVTSAAAIGPAVGLSQGLRRPDTEK